MDWAMSEDFGASAVVLCEILAAATVTALLTIVVYRLTFHPLAKYPGPLLGKITDGYTVYHLLKGDRHLDIYRLHQRYGPIVRLGPNRISLNTATALRDIYSVTANVQKSKVYTTFKHFFKEPMSHTTIDKRQHAFKRRINVRALADDWFRDMEEPLLSSVRLFCASLADYDDTPEWSSAKNMSEEFAYITSDVMGDVVFSRNWQVMKSEENRPMLKVMQQGAAGINLTGHIPFVLKLGLEKVLFAGLMKDVYRFKALSQAQAVWRLEQGDNLKRKDIFSTLMKAKDPETGLGFTQTELVAEAGLLIVAGADNIGTGMTATLFYLLHDRRTLERLQAELDQTFQSLEEIKSGAKLSGCHYLNACVKETMRMTPPVGAVLPREVCSGGIVLDETFFPQGTDVGVATYSLHHDERYFEDPFAYKPERWIVGESGTTAESVAVGNSAYHPFGIGRTSCTGQKFAYLEMAIILARVLWIFDLRIESGSTLGEGNESLGELRSRKNEFQTKDIFVSSHEGPMVQFKRRRTMDHAIPFRGYKN